MLQRASIRRLLPRRFPLEVALATSLRVHRTKIRPSSVFSSRQVPQLSRAVSDEFLPNPQGKLTIALSDSGPKFNDGLYNRSGRGFPDVSAVGQNIMAYVETFPSFSQGGTSASAPIFASLLNRINEVRLAAGKSTVGFVNPVLVSLVFQYMAISPRVCSLSRIVPD